MIWYNARLDLIGESRIGGHQVFVVCYYGPYDCNPWAFISDDWELIGEL